MAVTSSTMSLTSSEIDIEQDGRRARRCTAPGLTISPICRAIDIPLPPVLQNLLVPADPPKL
jgi:hypothetical protein